MCSEQASKIAGQMYYWSLPVAAIYITTAALAPTNLTVSFFSSGFLLKNSSSPDMLIHVQKWRNTRRRRARANTYTTMPSILSAHKFLSLLVSSALGTETDKQRLTMRPYLHFVAALSDGLLFLLDLLFHRTLLPGGPAQETGVFSHRGQRGQTRYSKSTQPVLC